jgi:hypothetical protein
LLDVFASNLASFWGDEIKGKKEEKRKKKLPRLNRAGPYHACVVRCAVHVAIKDSPITIPLGLFLVFLLVAWPMQLFSA